MRRPEDGDGWQRRKLLQDIGIRAATIVALGSVMFTLGFFVGRASGGTELEVYVQNPDGVYLRAESAQTPSGTTLMERTLTAASTASSVSSSAAPSAVPSSAVTSETAPTRDTQTPETTAVPETTEVSGTAVSSSAVSTAASVTAAASGKVNINTATAAELDTLPGIGPVKAQSIIAYREANGSFSSIEDLILVDGIGEKTMAELRPLITTGE
ncbi:MAG: helix-hairpin-helix domain-containing protein [Clostridiaceae bacterium]|nr:helix-hairpin-helix domain-containing protein [Clostridiaceae bacterium]